MRYRRFYNNNCTAIVLELDNDDICNEFFNIPENIKELDNEDFLDLTDFLSYVENLNFVCQTYGCEVYEDKKRFYLFDTFVSGSLLTSMCQKLKELVDVQKTPLYDCNKNPFDYDYLFDEDILDEDIVQVIQEEIKKQLEKDYPQDYQKSFSNSKLPLIKERYYKIKHISDLYKYEGLKGKLIKNGDEYYLLSQQILTDFFDEVSFYPNSKTDTIIENIEKLFENEDLELCQ